MNSFIRFAATVLVFALPCVASAGAETRQYCNEMYPADSYDAEERGLYIQECLDAYGESEQAEDVYAEEAADEPAYYEGTVEEFIEGQPEEQAE